jgi:PAS domain S-box-containing protein
MPMQAEEDNDYLQPFITLVEDISDAVCIASVNGTPRFINISFQVLTEYEHAEEFARHGGLPAVVGENVCKTIFSEIAKGHTWQDNISIQRKNREPIPIEIKAKPLRTYNGRIIGAAFYFKAIAVKEFSEEYLRLLQYFVDNANDAVMITEAEPIDEPGPRIVYINPAFTRITGYSKEEVLGKSPRKLQGPATNHEELDKVRKALVDKSKITVEIINYTKAGNEFWVEFSVVPVYDKNNKVTHFVSVQRETTHRKKMDSILLENHIELQKALQIKREIFEHSLDVICVFDEEGNFLHVSQASNRIWGYAPEELMGQSFTKLVYPEDLEKTIAIAGELSFQHTIQDFENRYVHRDGRLVPMMWTISWSKNNKAMYAIARDISERKVTEEKIKRSEQLYRSLLQNYPNGTITICDQDFRIVVMEGLELARFNVTSHMIAGKLIEEIFGVRTAKYIKEKLSPAFEGHTLSLELHVNGMYYMCTTVPLPEHNLINHIMVVTQDITARKKAEKKLEESYHNQQKLAQGMLGILNALPAQVALVDSRGVIIEVNEVWKKFAEQHNSPHENFSVGCSYIHVCSNVTSEFAEESTTVSQGIGQVISGQRNSFSLEYPCNTLAGEKWFNLVVSPMTQTFPTDVVVMHVDVTDRKRAEQKLQESEQQYKSLFEYHPDAVCALNLEGNFMSINPAMAALAGASVEELLHKPFANLIAPQNLEQVLYFFRKACEGHPQHYEISLTTQAGAEIRANILNIPIIVKHKITGVYCIMQDITPIRKAQQRAEDTAEHVNQILESIGDGFFTLDRNFNITYWNKMAEKIQNIQREKILGKSLWEVFPEAVSMQYFTEYRKALDEQVPVHFEEYHVSSGVWVELSAYPSREGLSVYFRDISERKKAEEDLKNYNLQLQKINYELDQFVYRASHDLRAPLVSVLGLINLAYIEKEETQIRHYLTLMEKSVRKLDSFIQDIIYYSKNSRTELLLSEADFESMVLSTIDDLKFMEEARTIDFRTDIKPVRRFYTDVNRLNVVLHNIIANAIRYHDPAKQQYIRVEISYKDTNHIQIVVEDNGQGIPREHQARIFEMFYRATEKNVGSGLGLYIVQENLKILKGIISLDSEPGRGTTFTIELPNMAAPKE